MHDTSRIEAPSNTPRFLLVDFYHGDHVRAFVGMSASGTSLHSPHCSAMVAIGPTTDKKSAQTLNRYAAFDPKRTCSLVQERATPTIKDWLKAIKKAHR